MMADNKPLFTIPAISETVSCPDLISRFGKVKGIKTGVYCHIAANLYLSHVDFP